MTIALLFCLGITAEASSCIAFEKIIIDIGNIQSGQRAKAVFCFKNSGDQDLLIKSIDTPCGCTEARPAAIKVPPGKSSSIEVTFKAETAGHKFGKAITVNSNDPANPAVRLTVIGNVVPIAIVTPERLNFGTIKVKSTVEKTVIVTPAKPNGFGIQRIDPGGPYVSAREFRKMEDGKGSYVVKVLIQAGDTPGRIMERLTIVTNLPGSPSIGLMVYGNVEEEASANAKPS